MIDLNQRHKPIDIRVGGTSKIKIRAVEALQDVIYCSVRGEHGSSGGVNEMPVGVPETVQGSINRAVSAWRSNPTGDLYFGIESGLMPMTGDIGINTDDFLAGNLADFVEDAAFFLDVPIVSLFIPSEGQLVTVMGRHCEFPKEIVLETYRMEGGFVLNTPGKLMQAKGIVKNHADPHVDLCRHPREQIIAAAVGKALKKYGARQGF